MDKKRKYGRTKSIDTEKKSVVAHVSTYTWDRTTERFIQGAWDWKNYLLNPVVLWGHNQHEPPIGKCMALSEDPTGLLAETVFDPDSPFAMKIFNLYAKGFLNAFSVGFIPRKYKLEPLAEGSEEKGIAFTDVELLEYSAVSVPANPGALCTRGLADEVMKTLGEDALIETKVNGDDLFIIPVGPQRFGEKKALIEQSVGDIDQAARYLIEAAKMAKAQNLPISKIDLIKNVIAVSQDLIPAPGPEPIPPESMERLSSAVGELGKAAASLHRTPENANTLATLARQLDEVLKAVRPD